MISSLRPTLLAFRDFLRTPTLGRRLAGLVALAILLMLVLNVSVFLMIRRTVEFNREVEASYDLRRATRSVLLSLVDAETGQRGFILTGQTAFLTPYSEAIARLPNDLAVLKAETRHDADLAGRAEVIVELSQRKSDEMRRSIELARSGRLGESIAIVRSGQGKTTMDTLRAEVAAIEEVLNNRLVFRTRQSEWSGNATVVTNAIGGFLILVLAGASGWLIRRYVIEIQRARAALDSANVNLEQRVRDRTFELTRANEEIQRFAYIVSHDLRAPLVNVMGYTSELEQAGRVMDRQIATIESRAPRSVDPDAVVAVREEIPEAISFIRASTAKMDRLINAILKLSREGRRNLVPEPLDMTASVSAIADSVRHQTQAANAEIVVETLPPLESDRLSIEQIFGNLIDNAVKYLDPARPGRIVVSGAESAEGWIAYRIADNGRGISDRDHERVFELFRRSGKQDRPGEGLGLAFVRNSVRRLGGDIAVESELGKGSTFIVKFPKRLNLPAAGEFA